MKKMLRYNDVDPALLEQWVDYWLPSEVRAEAFAYICRIIEDANSRIFELNRDAE